MGEKIQISEDSSALAGSPRRIGASCSQSGPTVPPGGRGDGKAVQLIIGRRFMPSPNMPVDTPTIQSIYV
jgi:hypothetical protein